MVHKDYREVNAYFPNSSVVPIEDIRQEALTLSSWGWSVIPLNANKKPVGPWKRWQTRHATDADVCRLFSAPEVGGIGVIPGAASRGLLIRDFDREEAYCGWADVHPDLAAVAPTVRTSRGFHVYTRTQSGEHYAKFADGELIGNSRHYAVAPPSRHPSGIVYRWLYGPPLGPSEFPVVDPASAGFLPSTLTPDTRHYREKHNNALCPVVEREVKDLPAAIREAVLRTLPRGAGQRNGRLHYFARSLRDLVPDDAPAGLLFDSVRAWWQLALPVIGTKDFETTLCDFRRAWSAVRVPISHSPPKQAIAAQAAGGGSPRERLLALCRELAASSTDGTFFLSVRDAGRACGLEKSQAAELLRRLVRSAYLERGNVFGPSTTLRLATVYRLGEPE